jgi:hypothetical protein
MAIDYLGCIDSEEEKCVDDKYNNFQCHLLLSCNSEGSRDKQEEPESTM